MLFCQTILPSSKNGKFLNMDPGPDLTRSRLKLVKYSSLVIGLKLQTMTL